MANAFRPFGFALALGLIAGAAAAHHSTGAYDMEHQTSVQGTLKSINWSNPHTTWVVDKDGETWTFESTSPGVLTRSGWTKHSIEPGERATFHYAPLRNQTQGGYLFSIILQDGKTLSYAFNPNDSN